MANGLSIESIGNIFLNLLNYDVFIESGTLFGSTTLRMKDHFKEVHTIELSPKYFHIFNENLKNSNIQNIKSYFGDSSKVIPEILKTLQSNQKCVFWLDGHWSSGDTAQGSKDCPLIEECLGINDFYSADDAIIIIDDYRLFGTKFNEDWLDINSNNIKKCFTKFRIKNECVFDDALILNIEKIWLKK